jgi:hypothetical protein
MEKKINHLEMIQGIINRMASNSFALKGWAVTLIAGIFALAGKDADKMYFLVAYIPIIIFWGLDSYYLLQERLYRALYDKVRLLPEEKIDFSMKVLSREFMDKSCSFLSCLFSKTEIWFYCPLAVVSTGIIIITHI